MRTFFLAVPLTVALACSKSPPEPVSKAPEAIAVATNSPVKGAVAPSGSTTTASGSTRRCTRPLATTQPPAVGPALPSACPKDPEGGQPMVPVKAVRFSEGADGAGRLSASIEAEIVGEGPLSERGLMYRLSMPADHGMLFDLEPKVHTFWMHNTCLPLDMIFAESDGYISGILENVPTLNDNPRSVGCEGRYVLETNAGWARSHGLKPGMFLKVE
jgi:hypothetical protein